MNLYNTITPEQKITKAKVSLINDDQWRWMSGVIMMGETKFVDGDHKTQTASTDGLNETYHKQFLAKLTDAEVKYLILHENFHKVFRHLFVWQDLWKQNPNIANIACDAVINNQQLANKQGIQFIEGGVNLPEYADPNKWNAKAIFDDLMRKVQQQPQSKAGFDDHQWEDAAELTQEEAKEVEKLVDAALRQASLAGALGGGMPRSIKQMLVPEVDWKTLLAEFIKAQCAGKDKQTWRRPHRTYLAYDLYIPDNYSEQVERIAIFGDTSGSITEKSLATFMGYMQQLCDEVHPNGLDIVWWDTKVRGVDSFERNALHGLANAVRPAGGGGTTPKCCADWLAKQPANKYICAVVVTDGEFFGDGVGQWDIPVLWLVVNNRTVPKIPVGVTVHVQELK